MIGGEKVNQTQLDHLPGQSLRAGARAVVVAGEASHVDLQQGTELLPGPHHLERIVTFEVAVPLRMGDDDLPPGPVNLADDVVVVAQEIEAELHQQKPAARQSDVAPAHDSPHCGRIRRQDLLSRALWRAGRRCPGAGGRQLVECPAVQLQLPIEGRLAVQVRHEEMRRGHHHPDPFAVETSQGGERLGHVPVPSSTPGTRWLWRSTIESGG